MLINLHSVTEINELKFFVKYIGQNHTAFKLTMLLKYSLNMGYPEIWLNL